MLVNNLTESPTFHNGFELPNSPPIDTCGGAGVDRVVTSSYLRLSFGVSVSGLNFTLPFTLPFVQTFAYAFPADFGVWQIDNLSAQNGPGGGWAFSYAAC